MNSAMQSRERGQTPEAAVEGVEEEAALLPLLFIEAMAPPRYRR